MVSWLSGGLRSIGDQPIKLPCRGDTEVEKRPTKEERKKEMRIQGGALLGVKWGGRELTSGRDAHTCAVDRRWYRTCEQETYP